MRLACLVTHPIQYHAPLFRRISTELDIELKVFFSSDLSVRGYLDAGFGTSIAWDTPLTEGYDHEYLPALGPTDTLSFWRPFNYGVAKRLELGDFDAIWIHGYMRWLNWSGIFSARRRGIKVLVRDEVTAISRQRGPLRKIIKKAFFRGPGAVVDGFLAIGSLNRDYYLQHGILQERIFMVPYAVDNSFFQARTQACADRREEFRASLGLEAGRPVILFAGKLMERKRPQDLLEAYVGLSPDGRTGPTPYLVYVGDGELRDQLTSRAASLGWKSIKFFGFRNQTELPAYFDLCDVFVMPSSLEPWGLVVNEAMNAGRPIVASDTLGCTPDLVRDGVNGRIFKNCDVADLTEALRDVLSDRQRCQAMGLKSLEIINRWSFEEDVAGLRQALGLRSSG